MTITMTMLLHGGPESGEMMMITIITADSRLYPISTTIKCDEIISK